MAFKRIDAQTVVDQFGNTMWLPDLSTPQPMGDGVPGTVPAPPSAEMAGWPAPPQNIPLPPNGAPPDPMDPSARLMAPGQDAPLPIPGLPGQDGPDAISGPTGPQGPAFGSPPPAEASTSSAPASPYQPPSLPGAPRSYEEAVGQENAAFRDATEAAYAAAGAQQDAQQATAQRQADAMGESVRAWDEQFARNQAAFDAAREKADQETADWLREQQEVASAKVDPSRYFSSRSGFSKTAWVVSLIASSISAGADQSRNVGLRMLKENIDQDIGLQKEEIQRRMEVVRTKGQAMDARHSRDFARLRDNEAAAWQRWSAVERHAMAKAAIPGPEAQRAAFAEVARLAAQEKVRVVETRTARAHQEWQQQVERRFRAEEARKDRSVQYSAQRLQRDRLKEDQRQFNLGRIDKYALAQMSAESKAGQGGLEEKDIRTLPARTGFRMKLEDGTETDLRIPKDRYDEVAKTAQVHKDKAVALQNLRRALSDATTVERWMNSDAELQSALNAAVAPVAKTLNGGGQLTEQDVGRAMQVVMGMDPQSFISKLKGPDKAEVMRLVDKQIGSLADNAATDLEIKAGVPLPKGARVVYTPDASLGWKDPIKVSVAEDLKAAGVSVPAPRHPITPQEYHQARDIERAGKGFGLPPLSPGMDATLEKFKTNAQRFSPKYIKEISEVAMKDLEELRKRSKSEKADIELADARVRLQVETAEAVKTAQDEWNQLRELIGVFASMGVQMAGDQIEEAAAKRFGITLAPDEVLDLAKEAERRARGGR